MRKNKEKVALGWYVPVEAKRLFVEFCAGVGSVAQEDCAGALHIWQHLPAAIREQAKLQAKGLQAIDKVFWEQFRAGLELAIQARQGIPPETQGQD